MIDAQLIIGLRGSKFRLQVKMKKLISYIIVAVVSAVAFHNYSESKKIDEEKRGVEEKKELRDRQALNEIKEIQKKFSANTDWVRIFKREKGRSIYRDVYAKDIEDVLINKKKVLYFGEIKDIRIYDGNSYIVILSTDMLVIELRGYMSKAIEYEVVCEKNMIEKVIENFNNTYRKIPGFGIRVAGVSEFSSIEYSRRVDLEKEHDDVARLKGTCNEIILAPQKFGSLRKEFFEWK